MRRIQITFTGNRALDVPLRLPGPVWRPLRFAASRRCFLDRECTVCRRGGARRAQFHWATECRRECFCRTVGLLMMKPSLISLRTFWREFAPLTSPVSLGSSLRGGVADFSGAARDEPRPRREKPTTHGACRHQGWRLRAASAAAGSSS